MAMDIGTLKDLVARTTPGPWKWWTSCSWRRLSSEARGHSQDGGVICPTVSRSDGHPDIIVSDADAAFIAASREAVPALIAEIEGLREALALCDGVLGETRRLVKSVRCTARTMGFSSDLPMAELSDLLTAARHGQALIGCSTCLRSTQPKRRWRLARSQRMRCRCEGPILPGTFRATMMSLVEWL